MNKGGGGGIRTKRPSAHWLCHVKKSSVANGTMFYVQPCKKRENKSANLKTNRFAFGIHQLLI